MEGGGGANGGGGHIISLTLIVCLAYMGNQHYIIFTGKRLRLMSTYSVQVQSAGLHDL